MQQQKMPIVMVLLFLVLALMIFPYLAAIVFSTKTAIAIGVALVFVLTGLFVSGFDKEDITL